MDTWAERSSAWTAPGGWKSVRVVDAHTAGEPLRVILDGFPALTAATVSKRRVEARARHDALRRALMWEPRGHADMYGCLVGPPVTPGADFSALFMHNEGFSTMCGHGIIGVVTVVLELGLVRRPAGEEARVGIDTPAGFVEARAKVEDGRVRSVSFVNVPSFVAARDVEADVPGVGHVRYDVAFGGAFYAFVEAEEVGLRLVPEEVGRLISVGRAIKRAAVALGEPVHPEDPDLGFLYGTIFVGPAHEPGAHSRNVCVFADGEVDRSPTGTGVSARLALHHARGELAEGEEIRIESILGTTFTGRVLRAARVGPHAAVVPEVAGSAWVTGRGELLLAPDDPLREGFLLR
jgi:trans-L-3-hydroxyproline dehydratase